MKDVFNIKPMGIVADLAAQDVPPDKWSAGYNVIFEDGRIRKSWGYSEVTSPIVCNAMIYTTDGNNDFWVIADDTGVEVWNGTGFSDITPVGWGATNNITMAVINSYVAINNPLSGLYVWETYL